MFLRSSLFSQYCKHKGSSSSLHPSQAILLPALSSRRETTNPSSSSLSKILILEIAGVNSPVCLNEQAISQVLHPPHEAISKITPSPLLAEMKVRMDDKKAQDIRRLSYVLRYLFFIPEWPFSAICGSLGPKLRYFLIYQGRRRSLQP